MHLFLLFSTLTTAAAALSAKEVGTKLWAHWLAGENDKVPAYYADEVTVYIDNDLATGGDLEYSGHHTLGKDLTIETIFEMFGAAWSKVHDVKYEFFGNDANHGVYVSHLVGRSSFSGQNERVDFIVKFNLDSDGKINHQEWHSFKQEALDAHSVTSKVYADWKDANPSTLLSSLHSSECDFRISGYTGDYAAMNGHYQIKKDFFAALAKASELYTDDLSTMTYNLHPGSPDGNSVSAKVSVDRTSKNGAKFRNTAYQTWTVDSFGKIVSVASSEQSKVPLNARAAWDATIALWSVGDLEGVMEGWAPEFTATFTGDVAGMRKFFPDDMFKLFGGKTVNRDVYAGNYVDMMTKFPIKSLDFEFLSQSVDELVVRFDSVQSLNGKDVASVTDWELKFNSDFKWSRAVGNVLYLKEAEQSKKGL